MSTGTHPHRGANHIISIERPLEPDVLHVQITERCNLACPKCYIPELNTTPSSLELTPGQFTDQLFAPAARIGYQKLVITGGEPYLSRKIYEIVSAARPHFTEIFVGTTGYFLTDEHCHKTMDAGVDFVQVSLDAVEPELLRRLTGIQNVDRLWENCVRFIKLRNERKAATRLVVAIVISPENIHQIVDVMNHCDRIGVDSVTLQAYHEYDVVYRKDGIDWPSEFPTCDDDFLAKLHGIVDAVLEAKRGGSRLYPHSALYFENLIKFFEDRANLDVPCSSDHFLFVDSRGFIRGCLFSEPLGHIANGLEGYLRSREFARFREFLGGCHLCTHGCAYRPPMDDE